MARETPHKNDANALMAVVAEFMRAHGEYLRKLAEAVEKHSDGFEALIEARDDPLAFGEKIISDVDEHAAVLWIKTVYRYQHAQQGFWELSGQKRLELAESLVAVANELLDYLGES